MATTKKTPAKDKKSSAIVDQAELSAKTPLPFESGKGFSYVSSSPYLQFLSPDDKYAKLLLEGRLLSATHNACITTKRDYCAGSGFHHIEANKRIDKKLLDWLKSVNMKDESAVEINRQIFEAFFTWGNIPIEMVRYEFAGKRYFCVYPHNLMEWRLGEPDSDGIVKYAIQSKLFLQDQFVFSNEKDSKTRKLPIYNPRNLNRSRAQATPGFNWVKDGNVERSLIWYKHSVSGFDNYGLPSAVAALIYQILEYKGARYNLDNFENNMVVSAILALKGSMSQPELNKIGKRIITAHTGDGKRGRVVVVGSEEGIDGSDIHNLDTHQEGSFKEIDTAWSEKIILANQWDAVLAGIVSPSTFGKGSNFVTKILEIKKNTVIKPAQRDLMDKVWSRIFTEVGKWMGWKIDVDNIEIKDAVDISGLTDVDITPAVKINEVRQSRGLPKDTTEKGDMYLGELKGEQMQGVYVKAPSKSKKKEKDVQQK